MTNKQIPVSFRAVIYEKQNVTDFVNNAGFTKCRCRVFYKEENANGSYITEEFAAALVDSAAGAPIVGLWDSEKQDFTDHSKSEKRRSYGFVSQAPNFEWEKHTDKDGVEREYAAFDVILWTALFKEAEQIVGAPLSMELNPANLSGHWRDVGEGHEVFEFEAGELLGICALGRDVEPCFEGASFFSEDDKILAAALKNYILTEFTAALESRPEGDGMNEPTAARVAEEAVIEETASAEAASDFGYKETTETHIEETRIIEPEVGEPTEVKVTRNVKEVWETRELEYQARIAELEKHTKELEDENAALKEFVARVEETERLSVIKQFEKVLTPEEIDSIDASQFTAAQLKEKFGAMAYEKIAATQASFQMIHSEIEKKDDADDVVRQYKEKK